MKDSIDKELKKIMDETAELLRADTLDAVLALQKKIEEDIKHAEDRLRKQLFEINQENRQ